MLDRRPHAVEARRVCAERVRGVGHEAAQAAQRRRDLPVGPPATQRHEGRCRVGRRRRAPEAARLGVHGLHGARRAERRPAGRRAEAHDRRDRHAEAAAATTRRRGLQRPESVQRSDATHAVRQQRQLRRRVAIELRQRAQCPLDVRRLVEQVGSVHRSVDRAHGERVEVQVVAARAAQRHRGDRAHLLVAGVVAGDEEHGEAARPWCGDAALRQPMALEIPVERGAWSGWRVEQRQLDVARAHVSHGAASHGWRVDAPRWRSAAAPPSLIATTGSSGSASPWTITPSSSWLSSSRWRGVPRGHGS